LTIVFFKKFHNIGTIHHQSLKALSVWPEVVRQVSKCKVATVFEIPAGRIGKINQKVTRLGATTEYLRGRKSTK